MGKQSRVWERAKRQFVLDAYEDDAYTIPRRSPGKHKADKNPYQVEEWISEREWDDWETSTEPLEQK